MWIRFDPLRYCWDRLLFVMTKMMVDLLSKPQIAELTELASRLSLRGLSSEVIVTTANGLLNSGVYDDTLLAIIDSSPAILSDVEPHFRRFLENASIPLPETETAIWQLLFFHISRIAETEGDPLLPLDDMINDVYYAYSFHNEPGKYLGESHGIHHLIRDYWLNDDLLDREAEIVDDGKTGHQIITEIRDSTKRYAKEWLDCYVSRFTGAAGGP